MMIGTILNAGAILLGGVAGLVLSRQIKPSTQQLLKLLLGVLTVFVGLKMTWSSMGGGLGSILKQLLIIILALTLGRLIGMFCRLQNGINQLGQYAQKRIAATKPDGTNRFNDGFVTCTILFCVGPIAVLGSIQDGLQGQWQTLGIKAAMDGLAAMAFVSTFGWGVLLSVVPVVAYQGTITLCAMVLAPHLQNEMLLNAFAGTGGILVFCIALIILEVKKIALADYLPSLAVAPLLAWWWGW